MTSNPAPTLMKPLPPAAAARQQAVHSVEKIGGTSMSAVDAVFANILLAPANRHHPYQRVFVVSAYGGVTNSLLEHKKSGEPGVYALFAASDSGRDWGDALAAALERMLNINSELFAASEDRLAADRFISERVSEVRHCLNDLQRICSFGHFDMGEQLGRVREMLACLGEAHSAFNTVLLLKRRGVNGRFVDLTGWRGDQQLSLEVRILEAFKSVDLATELPIVTGYAHCRNGLMHSYDRGYSEITFSALAAVTGAREAIIHKEYHLSSADPLLVGAEQVVPIGRTNYDVADQLSLLGMEAIHPQAARRLRQAGIPLRIKNTFEPDHPGTLIDASYRSRRPCVEIIAGRPRLNAIAVFDHEMVGQRGYEQRVLALVERSGLALVARDHNANSLNLYLAGPLAKVQRLIAELQEQLPTATISGARVAVVAAIGSDLRRTGLLAQAVDALAAARIGVLATQQSCRQVEIRFIVADADYQGAVQALHRALVECHNHGEAICAA